MAAETVRSTPCPELAFRLCTHGIVYILEFIVYTHYIAMLLTAKLIMHGASYYTQHVYQGLFSHVHSYTY